MFVNVSYTHVVVLVSYLTLTIAAVVSIWRYPGADAVQRVLWTAVVVVAPFIGALLWLAFALVASRRRATSGS